MLEINIARKDFTKSIITVEILDFDNFIREVKTFSDKVSIKSEKSILNVYRNKIEFINLDQSFKSLIYNVTDNNCDDVKIDFSWGNGAIFTITSDNKINKFGVMSGNFESLF